jgi:periplasmic protein TonB
MNARTGSSAQSKTNENMATWPNVLAGAMAGGNWGRGVEALRAKELSLVTHLLLAVLVLFPIFNSYVKGGPDKPPSIPILFPGFPPQMSREAGDGKRKGAGNGGAREAEEARQGQLPRVDLLQLTPPSSIRNPQPKLPAEATVVGAPQITAAPPELWGNPFSRARTDSQGPGIGNGYGSGCCGGVGPGNGPGSGPGAGTGVGESEIGQPGRNGVGYPECSFCPTPSFSEEARKTKTQGAVTLQIVVGTDGRASNIRVLRGLGMGLDERAIEAVRGWRFKPAQGPGGKAVATEVLIEVTFRLL